MSRLPPVPPSKLNEEQKQIHDEMHEGATKAFADKGFKFQQEDGALIGPFAPLMYLPKEVAQHFFGLATALATVPGLSAAARETAIIATGALFECKYELYAHKNIAITTGVLSEKQVNNLLARQPPGGEDGTGVAAEDVDVAYEVTVATVTRRGPLSSDLWDKAVSVMGNAGAAALLSYVGTYCFACVLMNGTDVPLPAEAD